jgi:hypothetical protein
MAIIKNRTFKNTFWTSLNIKVYATSLSLLLKKKTVLFFSETEQSLSFKQKKYV